LDQGFTQDTLANGQRDEEARLVAWKGSFSFHYDYSIHDCDVLQDDWDNPFDMFYGSLKLFLSLVGSSGHWVILSVCLFLR
jgi:hypothetical protein